LQIIKSLLFNLILYLSVIPISVLIILLYPFVNTTLLQKFASNWIFFILSALKLLCGVRWKIEGIKNLPKNPCILVSNHQGVWESLFLQTLYYPSTSIVKKELLYIPLFGWAFACLKPIYINRSNKIGSLKKVVKEGSSKLNQGFSIIIFPEGTRARPNKGLKPFSASCGLLAVKNNIPIVPICHNSGLYWKNRRFIKEKGEIIIRIGPLLFDKNPKKLTNKAYTWINKNFDEIN